MSTGHDNATYDADFVVQGMTCEHCVRSVTEEIQEIPGVHGVRVDLTTGSVTVTSNRQLDRAQVGAAVEEAGYALQ